MRTAVCAVQDVAKNLYEWSSKVLQPMVLHREL